MKPRLLSFAEARVACLAAAMPLPPESIDVANVRGRALRETVLAPHALPPFDNSAMDGFAVPGADLAAGAIALHAGRELSAYDLALLVALGQPRVAVGPRPFAAIVSTGDELLDAAATLRPGAIRDSNAPMLRALLEEAGCEVI